MPVAQMRSIHVQQTVYCVRTDDRVVAVHVHPVITAVVIGVVAAIIDGVGIVRDRWIHADAELSCNCRYGCHILAVVAAIALRICWSVLCGKFHSLLFLTLITEPHAHHILLQIQFLGDGGYLLT